MTQMPVNSPSLPGIRQPLLEGTSASRPYYLFLQWVATNLSSLSATVDDLSARQGGISISPDANVTGQNSIKTRGALSEGIVQVLLQGDVSVAGNTQYYGSDQSGNKGWYPVASALAGSANVDLATASNGVTTFDLSKPVNSGAGTLQAVTVDAYGRITGTRAATITGTAGRVTVANGDASAGLPTLDLATVADAGGGALLRFVRDAWGRISGTSAATTTDLAEGSNLYFTAARVLATVLAGLSTATNAVITAADTVLSAIGKLQAQISEKAPLQKYGTYAARPVAAGSKDVIYYASDVQEAYYSDGSTWTVLPTSGGELGYAETTTVNSTSSSTPIDIPGLSVTCVVGEKPVYLEMSADMRNQTAGGVAVVYVIANGVQVSRMLCIGGFFMQSRKVKVAGLTPGNTYVFKLQFSNGGTGIVDIYGDASDRPCLIVSNA